MVYAFLIFGKIVEKLLFKLIDVFCCLQRSLWGIVSNLREHNLSICAKILQQILMLKPKDGVAFIR